MRCRAGAVEEPSTWVHFPIMLHMPFIAASADKAACLTVRPVPAVGSPLGMAPAHFSSPQRERVEQALGIQTLDRRDHCRALRLGQREIATAQRRQPVRRLLRADAGEMSMTMLLIPESASPFARSLVRIASALATSLFAVPSIATLPLPSVRIAIVGVCPARCCGLSQGAGLPKGPPPMASRRPRVSAANARRARVSDRVGGKQHLCCPTAGMRSTRPG